MGIAVARKSARFFRNYTAPAAHRIIMLRTIAILLLVLWLLGWLGLHLLGGAIHILLILAIICFVLGLVKGL
jgi:hypothetical protein